MSFLQSWMLWVLPAIALPILIHLLYQHRHRSVEWAAMMFLVKAERQPGQAGGAPHQIPVQFEINGVRSTIDLELDSQGASLQGHRIPIDQRLRSGWGSVSIPEDSNALDNRFYFVFSEPPARRAVIVSDSKRTAEAFQLALSVPMEQG